jgi:hypothetical protein
MRAEGGDGARARLAHGFRLCTARAPTEPELEILLALLATELEARAQDPEREAAAWSAVGAVLLNLDETITKG